VHATWTNAMLGQQGPGAPSAPKWRGPLCCELGSHQLKLHAKGRFLRKLGSHKSDVGLHHPLDHLLEAHLGFPT